MHADVSALRARIGERDAGSKLFSRRRSRRRDPNAALRLRLFDVQIGKLLMQVRDLRQIVDHDVGIVGMQN